MGWTRQEVLDVARSTGKPVVEAWSTHNAGTMGTVLGPMLHHTGSTWAYPNSKAPTLKTVREGRSDLQNALCMFYIDYEGVIYCITEKIAWHAGGGSWQGVTDGNGHYAGIEAESDGKQWTKATVATYHRLAAAILRKTGRSTGYAPLHKQYALPPGRKTDFSGMDPAAFLADVNAVLAGNPTSEEDELMAAADDIAKILALLDWYFVPDDDPGTPVDERQPNSKGEFGKRIRGTHAAVAVLLARDPATIDADAIAAAIPHDIAQQVIDALGAKLSNPVA